MRRASENGQRMLVDLNCSSHVGYLALFCPLGAVKPAERLSGALTASISFRRANVRCVGGPASPLPVGRPTYVRPCQPNLLTRSIQGKIFLSLYGMAIAIPLQVS